MSGFINPHLLWGLLLLAAPIIIHLLNKRRFEVHQWAAMEFLLKADVKNRRRLQIEDLLLLLLRAAVVGAAVFLVARPLVQGWGGRDESARTIVIDDSFSMEHRQAAQSALERAREVAANEVQQAIASGARVTVRRGTRPADLVGSIEERIEGGEVLRNEAPGEAAPPPASEGLSPAENGLRLLAAIRALQASDGSLRFAEALEAEARALEEDKSGEARSIELVSDLRRSDWLDASGELKPRLKEAFARLVKAGGRDRSRLRILPVGEPGRENTAAARVAPDLSQPIAGIPVTIVVEARNFGVEERKGLSGELEVGDPANPTHRIPLPVFPPIPPGGSATVAVDHVFPAPGEYPLAARLDEDRLTRDDRAFAVAVARDALSVLVVDGDPGAERLRGESGFLAAALAPRGGLPTGIRPEVVRQPVTAAQLKGRDAAFLLNCPDFSPEERSALERFAEGGGGLAFFLGSRVEAETYRRALGAEGILPASLTAPVEAAGGARIDFGSLSHPALKVYQGFRDASVERIAAARYFALAANDEKDVVARYADAARTPAVLERAVGTGRTSLFNISADRDWTDWPTDPSYPVVLQEWVRHIAPRRGEARGLRVGDPIAFAWEGAAAPSVVDPRGETRPAALGGSQARFEGTDLAGFYRTPASGPASSAATAAAGGWFAVNRPAEESDLTPATEAELRQALSGVGIPFVIGGAESGAAGDAREGDIWRWLALSAGLLLLAELAMAWWIGRR